MKITRKTIGTLAATLAAGIYVGYHVGFDRGDSAGFDRGGKAMAPLAYEAGAEDNAAIVREGLLAAEDEVNFATSQAQNLRQNYDAAKREIAYLKEKLKESKEQVQWATSFQN